MDADDAAPSLSISRSIEAPAADVWDLVADVTRMGEWSPEAVRHRWLGGADGPTIGARFKGTNRRGVRRWSTVAEVVACEPARHFAFDVSSVFGLPVAHWGYRIEDAGDGTCVVTEEWEERRGWFIKALGLVATGVNDRSGRNRETMTETLGALAAAAESGARPGGPVPE